jgi:hypothetical protein
MKLITKEEMEKAIKNILKNEKSSGEDKIVNEYLTHSTNSIFDIYVKLCNALYSSVYYFPIFFLRLVDFKLSIFFFIFSFCFLPLLFINICHLFPNILFH